MGPAIIVGIIMFAFVSLIKILSDTRVRTKLIEAGLVDERAKFLYADRIAAHVPSALKWGIVLVAIGLAVLIGELLPYRGDQFTIALILLMAGAGLLVYYYLAGVIIAKRKEHTQ